MSLDAEDRDALSYSTKDVAELVQELASLDLSTTFKDFTTKVQKLLAEHGPEIAMAAVRLSLRLAGVAL